MRKSRFRASPGRALRDHARPALPPSRHDQDPTMDIERINAIGKSIADLTERTTALRGYL